MTDTLERCDESRFYGFEWGTYFEDESGRYWLIQSDDRDDLPVEVDDLPEGGQWLPNSVCMDINVNVAY